MIRLAGVFSGQQGIVTGEIFPVRKRHAILTLGDGTEIDLKDEVARMNLSKRQEAPHVGEGLYLTGVLLIAQR